MTQAILLLFTVFMMLWSLGTRGGQHAVAQGLTIFFLALALGRMDQRRQDKQNDLSKIKSKLGIKDDE